MEIMKFPFYFQNMAKLSPDKLPIFGATNLYNFTDLSPSSFDKTTPVGGKLKFDP